jgi:hypothetical protein
MTEKRFNVFDVDGTIFLEDHRVGSYHIGEIGNVDVNCLNDIADRLNELNDENKELKDLLKSMADRNNEIWLDNGQIIRLKKVFKGEWTND